jgi:hypothetical protein
VRERFGQAIFAVALAFAVATGILGTWWMAVLLGVALGGFGLTLWQPGRTVPAVQPQGPSQQTNVTSHNQQGGITAGTVNVNAAPQPSVKYVQTVKNRPIAEGYLSRFEVEIEAAHAVLRIDIYARAASIIDTDLRSASGVMFDHRTYERLGLRGEGFASPPSRLTFDVVTVAPEDDIDLSWELS